MKSEWRGGRMFGRAILASNLLPYCSRSETYSRAGGTQGRKVIK
jgi:hypothetical protein